MVAQEEKGAVKRKSLGTTDLEHEAILGIEKTGGNKPFLSY